MSKKRFMRKNMTELAIENKPLEEIKPFQNNPRVHSELQVKQICKSISEFGFVNPILLDENNTILAGHGRFLAAEMLKMTTIPTVKVTNLNDKQKKALVIADNKITLNSVWDTDRLWEQVKQLNAEGFDLDILAFDNNELLPMIDSNTVLDVSGEWENMPEFVQGDKTPYQTIFVHFTCETDREKFADLIQQPLTEKTKTVWYPQQESMDTVNKRYE
tara:strand:- start:118 stop:768 length:651 start_codon:yes stop_codon:yes gene_type:complete